MIISEKWSLYFELMSSWIRLGLKFYYKKVEIQGKENIPQGKPIIFAANHQCTFLDPILISVNSGQQPAFLTRSDVFKNPTVRKFLHSIRMLPIYRQPDGPDFIEKNQVIFENCMCLLEHNKSFMIFVEGSHSNQRKLRILKKGFARMAFDTLERNNYDLDIQIVPVGINYEDFYKFRKKVLINFGKPIRVMDYVEEYKSNPRPTLNKIKKDLHAQMIPLLIHIKSKEYYETYEHLREIELETSRQKLGLGEAKYADTVKAEQYLIQAVEKLETNEPEKMQALAVKVNNYQERLQTHKFRNHLFEEKQANVASLILQGVFFLLTLPIHLYGVLLHYITYKVPPSFSKKNFKDPMFHSSVNWVGGQFIGTIWYPLLILLFALISRNWLWTLLFAISLPLSAWFSATWWLKFKKWQARWRYKQFKNNKKAEWEKLNNQKKEIHQEIEGLL